MRINRNYLVWAGLGIIYAALTVLIPPDASILVKYHLSSVQARAISLSWIAPYIGIWFAAFYGYVQCKAYAALIRDSQDGQALDRIGSGLMWLAISLPVTAISSSLLNYLVRKSPHWQVAATIINNYLSLLFVVIGFITIYKGTRSLVKIVKKQPQSAWERIATVAFIVFCVAYAYLTLTNPARQFATPQSGRAAYYLPDFLLVTTIIIPYLLVWYWGFRSAYQLHLYQKNVRGVVYKSSLELLARGMGAVILALMSLRVLVSLTTLLNSLTLKLLLIVLYGLLVVVSVGYILIALGAKKLKKIEEV